MSKIINKRLRELRFLDYSDNIRNEKRSNWKNINNKILLWQIKPKTAKKIFNLTKKFKPKIILELGTSAGYSSLVFAKACLKTKIYTIECVPYRIKLAKESFIKTNLNERIILYENKINDVLKNWNKKIDLLFLDADKDNYINYTKKLLHFLNKNSIIIADNVLDNPKKTQIFINFMRSLKNFKTIIYKIDNGVLVSKKLK
jgi:caffeoyl-CoA O-methyltransferase